MSLEDNLSRNLETKIEPHKISKPIQILGLFFACLLPLVSTNFIAAAYLTQPQWLSPLLVITAIFLYVPLFSFLIYKLLTKHRTVLGDDKYFFDSITRTKKSEHEILFLILENTCHEIEIIKSNIYKIMHKIDVQTPELHSNIDISNITITHESEKLLNTAQNGVRISLNDKLPNYDDIKDCFESESIVVTDVFGSNSDPPTSPEIFSLVFGNHVPVSLLQKIIEILSNFNLETIIYTPKTIYNKRVIVGSYEYGGKQFDEKLKNTLFEPNLSDDALHRLF